MEGSLEDMEVPFGLLTQPEPEGLTDEEITDCLIAAGVTYEGESYSDPGKFYLEGLDHQFVTGVRAVIAAALARWGRPAIEPVPVAERLPGAEDCEPEGPTDEEITDCQRLR